MGKRYLCKKLITMKKLFTLFAAGALFATGAFAQLPTPFQVEPDAVKDFADKNVGRKAIQGGDRNQDGYLSQEEMDSLEVLNLGSYRIDPFDVVSYEDLAKFPNLKKVYLGESDLAEVDLSRNPKLEVIAIQSPNLKTVVIAVGSKPQFYFPTQSGEIVVRRVVNPDDPNAIWYQ